MKTVSKKLLSLIISFALIIGIVQSIGAIPVFAAGVSSVQIGISTLADGKYYTAKSNPTGEALLDEAVAKPSDGTPYLFYDNGTLTVNGDISLTSNMPTLSVAGGTLTIAGTGRLSLTSNMAPTVTMGEKDILNLAGGVGFAAYQMANSPTVLNGSFKTADGYSGNIDIFSKGNSSLAFCNMSEINVKTSGYIDIKSAGSTMLILSLGPVTLEGGSVRLANQGGGLIQSSSSISINATNDDLNLIGGFSAPTLIGTDITLAAMGDITVSNNNADGFAVGGNLKVTNAKNVNINSIGNLTTIQGNVDINASGDVNIASTQNSKAIGGDNVSIITTGGKINVFGSGNQSPVIDAKSSLKLVATGNVIVQRLNDYLNQTPVISAPASKTLTSKNGVVIVSGSFGTTITTKDNKTLNAVYGGDRTDTGIDLAENTPEDATLYLAGSGYALFTPANGTTPAKLDLCGASIEMNSEDLACLIELPKGEAINMQLSGKNTLSAYGHEAAYGITAPKGEQQNLTITSSDNGTLDISVESDIVSSGAIGGGDGDMASLTISGTAAVTATAKSNGGMASGTTISGGNLTVEPTAKFTTRGDSVDLMVYGDESNVKQAFDGTVVYTNKDTMQSKFYVNGAHNLPGYLNMYGVGTIKQGNETASCYLNITSGSLLTIPANDTLTINDLAMLKNDGAIVNNGAIVLPDGKTVDDIKALKITGTGFVQIGDKYYTNNGTAMTVVAPNSPDGLFLTYTQVTEADNKGYTWIKSGEGDKELWTLTLKSVYMPSDLILPDKNIVINTTEGSIIGGEVRLNNESGIAYALKLTFTGTAPLTINGRISGNGADNNVVTVKDGAQVLVRNNINIGASGGANGTLSVEGKGTSLNVVAQEDTAVHCGAVNVKGGASLTVSTKGSMGIFASGGDVNVAGGSTLTAGCEFGVYVKDGGMLNVDDTSKLITNASVASFCVVDNENKPEAQVVKLPSIPDGTKINTAYADDGNLKYALWSLTLTDGKLSVIGNPTSEPAELVGAAVGNFTFAKAANPNNPDNPNNPNNPDSNSSDDDDDDTIADNNKALGNADSKPANAKASKADENPQTGAADNAICPVAITLILSAAGIVLIRRRFKKI